MSSFRFSSLFLLAAVASVAYATKTCSVLNYGAVADNDSDVGPAITKAYTDCVSGSTTDNPADTILHVPDGLYAIKTPVAFKNTDYFTMQMDGDINLIFDANLGGNIFSFVHCDHVVWTGKGTVYGHGDQWRPGGSLTAYPNRPRLLRFQDCNNADISGVTLYNSPMFHLVVHGNNNVVHDMKITADHIGETDGINVSGSNNYVHDVSVENGDECVTVKSPAYGFVAENIRCNYTGGCNIGSFGKDATDVSVKNIYYRNVQLYNSDGGIVLKSFPHASGVVMNATYVDFTLENVAYPIMISNHWCPQGNCSTETGDLIWKDIAFHNISGTGDSSDRPTIEASCTPGPGCTDIVFENVNISKEGDRKAQTLFLNACGRGLSDLAAC